ncbi:MAG: DUF2752 domain-containing protein [Calditrichaeota bacterium]|nr:MAG: DUF2752 domain-containing protein [Calditrichota bacterium]MBL1207791.1 DUF2752 domain-containing protein [Calditrichota bacterium]NOG47625.1 DUF2752 domain-containing protein [Calditrichota bacterium]
MPFWEFKIRALQKTEKVNKAYGLLFFSAIFISLFLIDPINQEISSCYFLEITGHNCPTCGMTRSFYSMTNADISGAFSFHYFGPIIFFILILAIIKFSLEIFFNKNLNIIKNYKYLFVPILIFVSIWIGIWSIKEFFL